MSALNKFRYWIVLPNNTITMTDFMITWTSQAEEGDWYCAYLCIHFTFMAKTYRKY